VDSVIAEAKEHYTRECELRKRGYDLEKIAERAGEIYGIKVGEVLTKGRQQRRVVHGVYFVSGGARIGKIPCCFGHTPRNEPGGVGMPYKGRGPCSREWLSAYPVRY